MVTRRRSGESGHRRKFLVVVDETPECDRAVVYAARRAASTGGLVVLLNIIDDTDFRGFIGVERAMREEAREEATVVLARFADRARAVAGGEPELVIGEGQRGPEIIRVIDEDEDIAILVLAAGTGSDGPGPLVTTLAGQGAAGFPVPITVVPGTLSDEDIAGLA